MESPDQGEHPECANDQRAKREHHHSTQSAFLFRSSRPGTTLVPYSNTPELELIFGAFLPDEVHVHHCVGAVACRNEEPIQHLKGSRSCDD
eukprot:CAMPEP_0181514296 /NCGR_PEP_ID=MMETSP1110-20121109/62956_1 /TAXON_ID=174948 /ORGANISM="Symbiodinium sp., Strain CCMP421" /LENGTH=90 /DNA_ID=CAMNT_0023644219 /DNA_START=274 /DNA_END=543 /DNA_ORIENTATION=-